MFDELPLETSFRSQDAFLAPRSGGVGPKLVLAVFVIALTFDVIGRVAQHLLLRALRRPLALRQRSRGELPRTV